MIDILAEVEIAVKHGRQVRKKSYYMESFWLEVM